jgi:hypothetical protein
MIAHEAPGRWPRWLVGAALIGGLALFLALNAVFRPFVPLPEGAVRIPTSDASPPDLCTLQAAVSPVRGVLRGTATQTAWPVWLSRPAGHVAYVVWPHGWSARLEPELVLLDEAGRVAAEGGDEVVLGQVPLESAAGTTDDPYLAVGLFLDRCYGRPG